MYEKGILGEKFGFRRFFAFKSSFKVPASSTPSEVDRE